MIKKIIDQIRSYIEHMNQKRLVIIGLALTGIILILVSNLFKHEKEFDINVIKEQEETEQVTKIKEEYVADINEMEKQYEKNLAHMLNKINGVTEVEVMVNIDSTNIQMYEKDVVFGSQTTVETDQSGGRRTVEDETKETKLVYVRRGDEEVPVLLKTEKPPIRGVFIIAKGVGNATVKQRVVEAVSRVLDVPTYRISVLAK